MYVYTYAPSFPASRSLQSGQNSDLPNAVILPGSFHPARRKGHTPPHDRLRTRHTDNLVMMSLRNNNNDNKTTPRWILLEKISWFWLVYIFTPSPIRRCLRCVLLVSPHHAGYGGVVGAAGGGERSGGGEVGSRRFLEGDGVRVFLPHAAGACSSDKGGKETKKSWEDSPPEDGEKK